MNSSTIERLIINSNNTPKGLIKGKKISGAKKRKTTLYWTDVNRILRKKEKRIRYESPRIESIPDQSDDFLENIHYANYLGQKDISEPPPFHTAETIVLSKTNLYPGIGKKLDQEQIDQFSAWDMPVWEEQAYQCYEEINEFQIPENTQERLFIRMPEFLGDEERYKNLQQKYNDLVDAHQEYMELMFAYEKANNFSDDDSIRSYESKY